MRTACAVSMARATRSLAAWECADIRDSLGAGDRNRSIRIILLPVDPVPIQDRADPRGGNREKNACDAAQLRPPQHRQDDRPWTHRGCAANETRGNDRVLS